MQYGKYEQTIYYNINNFIDAFSETIDLYYKIKYYIYIYMYITACSSIITISGVCFNE